MKKPDIWFQRVMWLGIVANWILSLPTMFAPEKVLALLGLRPTGDEVWTAFAANLLILLSLLYVPAALDVNRYRLTAWFAVAARLAGVLFFFVLYAGTYPVFGFFDLSFLVVQLPLLILTARNSPSD